MKLWNGHMYRNPALGSKMLIVELDRFVDAHAADIVGMNLYKNFVLHLTNLVEFGVIDKRAMIRAVERMQDRACEPAPAQPAQPAQPPQQQHCHHQQTPLPQQQQSQPEQQLPRQSPRKRRTAMERGEVATTVNGGKNDNSRETAAASREATASVPENKEPSSRTSRCSTPMSLHLELSEDEEEDEDDSPIISSEDEGEEEKMDVDSPIISSQGPNLIETFLASVLV